MPRSTANSTAPGDIPAVPAKVTAMPRLSKGDADELAAILDEAEAAVRRHVIFTDDTHAKVIAAYVVTDYCRKPDGEFYFPYWLYLYFRSAGSGHGKSRIQKVIGALVARTSGILVSPSEPSLLREAATGCLLQIDEITKLIETGLIYALLTAGNEKGAEITRFDPATGVNSKWTVFGPKTFSGRNNKRELPDDILRRCYVIDTAYEPRARLKLTRRWDATEFERVIAAPLRERASRWAARSSVQSALRRLADRFYEVKVPDELYDWQAESWGPLIAVTGLATGTWKKEIIAAALAEVPDEDEPQAPQSDTFDNDLRAILSRPSPLFRLGAYNAKTREQENPDAMLRGSGLACSNFGWSGKGKAPLIGSVEYDDATRKLHLRVSKTKDRPDWNRLVQMVNKVRMPGSVEYDPVKVLREYRDTGLLETGNDRQALKLKTKVWARDPKQDSTVVIDISSWLVPVPYQRDIPADGNVPEAFKGMEEYDEDE